MRALFGAILDGEIDDLELGGLLLALRVNGASSDELDGALDALQSRLLTIVIDPGRPVVSLPAYQQARDAFNLTPMLAFLLADAGVQVIVHAHSQEGNRVGSAEVFRAMGLQAATTVDEAAASLELGNPAFVPIELLNPSFAALLRLRERPGVRHLGHTLARLIAPARGAAQPGVRALLGPGGGTAAGTLTGTAANAATSVSCLARIDWVHDGTTLMLPTGSDPGSGSDGVPAGAPAWMPERTAVGTAAAVLSTLAGERPVPAGVAAQVRLILASLANPPAWAARETRAKPSPPTTPQ